MFVATDKDGNESIYQKEPKRSYDFWDTDKPWYVNVPKGTIERLLNYPLTWDDEAEEIVEYKNNSTLNDDDITRILKASEDQPIEYLSQKIINLHDQLNKNRKTVQNQKEEITRLLLQKEDLQSQLNMANKTVGISINNGIDLVKYLEEKDAIIKYLENKLAKKTNEASEKKVMSFEELYIKQADEYYKKVEDKVMGFVKKNLESKLYN